MGMTVLLASLSMLFGAALAGYLAVRLRAPEWPPPGSPPLPAVVALSTAILAASSFTMTRASRALRRGCRRSLLRSLAVTLGLGVVFLGTQAAAWAALTEARPADVSTLFQFTLLMLGGLHALHVLGGLAALTLVAASIWRAPVHLVPASRVRHTSTYWHYLGVVWVLIVAVLLAG